MLHTKIWYTVYNMVDDMKDDNNDLIDDMEDDMKMMGCTVYRSVETTTT